MEANSGIDSKEGVCRVHKSLFLVRLSNENTKPHVEWSEKGYRSQNCLLIGGLRPENCLEGKQWCSQHSKNEPDIEVKQQVPDIERPWLCAKDLRASSFAAKDVVSNNIPRNNSKLSKKHIVNSNFRGLQVVNTKVRELFPRKKESIPKWLDTAKRHQRR